MSHSLTLPPNWQKLIPLGDTEVKCLKKWVGTTNSLTSVRFLAEAPSLVAVLLQYCCNRFSRVTITLPISSPDRDQTLTSCLTVLSTAEPPSLTFGLQEQMTVMPNTSVTSSSPYTHLCCCRPSSTDFSSLVSLAIVNCMISSCCVPGMASRDSAVYLEVSACLSLRSAKEIGLDDSSS